MGNIIGSGTALTNSNYNSISNPPSLVSFCNTSTLVSTLNISGTTTLNNTATLLSSLNIVGNIIGSGTALINLNYYAIPNKSDLSVYVPITHMHGNHPHG